MHFQGPFTLTNLFRHWPLKMAGTGLLVLLETLLIALIPLLLGWSIDDLLNSEWRAVQMLAGLLGLLAVVAVGRRLYDTRVYGAIRVSLATAQDRRQAGLDISTRNLRLGLVREYADFLEDKIPLLLAAAVQVLVSLYVFYSYHWAFALAACGFCMLLILIYSLFHKGFLKTNRALNTQMEQQVSILEGGTRLHLFRHLRNVRRHEISLSDREAYLYGGIFVTQAVFILAFLVTGTQLPGVTAGQIFALVTYAWEFVEAVLALPLALQDMTRLQEISDRLNKDQAV